MNEFSVECGGSDHDVYITWIDRDDIPKAFLEAFPGCETVGNPNQAWVSDDQVIDLIRRGVASILSQAQARQVDDPDVTGLDVIEGILRFDLPTSQTGFLTGLVAGGMPCHGSLYPYGPGGKTTEVWLEREAVEAVVRAGLVALYRQHQAAEQEAQDQETADE
jgi:hypothetical protein